ncbi:hypothetical protein F4604DRAFT_1793778 [Suillus subluteus]|nr:hypothetical protein F4604DRAFT_1793778 [Suillus subluteus]
MSKPPIFGDPASQGIDELLQRAHKLYTKALQGNPSDLDIAIAHYRGTLGGDLANALVVRFQQQGSRADLACAMECHLEGLALRPIGHPMRVVTLVDFATALLLRFKEDGTLNDIHLAIDNFAAALSQCPFDHPARCTLIMKYAGALLSRFEYCGDAEDAERAIEQYQTAVDLTSPHESPAPLNDLAKALQSRFQRFHELNDLESSIQHSSAALHLLPTYHPDRPQTLRTIASGLFERFRQKGDAVDLETARRYYQAVLDLCSQEHPYHALALNNLADGDSFDLDLAISHYRTACIHSEGQPDQGLHLDHLGNAQLLQFRQCGDMNHNLALELHPVGHHPLASCLDARFEQQGELADFKTALNCYNHALAMYFRQYKDLNELNRCITYYREALELYPATHVDRPITLTGLACALLSRFELIGDEFDLDQASLHCTVALDARPLGHPARPISLLTMARIFRSRFLPWDDPKKLDSAFEHLRAAKDACRSGHSLLLDIHAELSVIYFLRYLVFQHSMDLKEALGYHELSMAFGSGGIWAAFRASLYWVQSAEMFRHASAVDAYQTALRLLDRCVTVAKAPELRQELTKRHAELMLDAFSAAIRHKQPDLAVEMLEQGRLLLWTQVALHRSILDDLRSCGKQGVRLANSFEQLNHQIECGWGWQSSRESSHHHRDLQKQRDAVIAQIRRLDGFSNFFIHPSFADIQRAAIDGPVIVVNASHYLCNAIIIFTTGQPALVPLPNITLTDVARLAALFHDIVRYSGDPDPGRDRERRLIDLLTELWDLVVSPVVDRLLPHTPKGSRIWWCPTGKFTALPLHAAGLYQSIELNLSQLYISSYTPTLSSLIKSRRTKSSTTPRRPSFTPFLTNFLKGRKSKSSRPSTPVPVSSTFAAICNNERTEDIDMLRKVLPPTCTMTRITDADATHEHSWIHFASGAEPNFDLPFKSHFPLHDKPMFLLEIAQTLAEVERPPEFAFLSVNHGSSGTEGHETMHIPHALHMAGFQSVVGTMWAVDEEVTRRIASAFYHFVVVESGGAMDCANAAKALSQALQMQRIAFVHVGV